MVYFALALSHNAIHFRCNAAAAPGVLPRGGGRRSRSHASGSFLYTSFLDHCTLVKRNLAIGLTTDHRIKIDCKWKGTRASLDARNVSSGRVLAAAASSSVSEGTVTVEEVLGASPPTTTGGESLVEEENAAAAEENTSVGDAPTSCVETTDEEEATEASSVDTPTKPMMQQTSKLSGRSNGHATAAAAAKKLKIRTIRKEELILGAVFAGKVRAVQAYGALVDIGAFTDGLLHISQLSSNYVSQVPDVVSVGQEVIVRVVDVDEMAGRIALTMWDETKVADDHQQTQTLKENQSRDASQGCQQEDAVSKRGKITGKKSRERGKRDEQKQKVGKLRKNQELQGKVKKIIRSGAIVELLDHGEEEGFIRSSSLAVGGDENVSAETLLLHVGQQVKVRVAKIEKGKVILTMMPEEEKEAEEVVMKSIDNSINKIANVVDASNDDAFQLNFQMENSIRNCTQVASEESSIQKSALPEEQASPEIQEATAEDQVKDVISEQSPLASDLAGATTEGSVINKNGDVGVLNPFELDSSVPTKLIGNATQVASAAIEKLSKLVEEQASAELVEETEFQGEDVVLVQQTILGDFVEATAGIGIVPEEPQAKLSDTNKEFFNPAEDAMGAELVEAEEEGIEKVACEETANGKFVLPEEQASAELVEETEFQGEDVVPVQQTILGDFVEATAGIGIVTEEPQAKLSDTNKEFLNPAADAIGAELVEAEEEGIEKVACEETANGKFVLPEEQASAELVEETEFQGEDVVPVQQTILGDFVEATAGIGIVTEEPQAKLSDTNKEFLNPAADAIGAELVEAEEEGIEKVACEETANGKFVLPEEQASAELVEETEFQGEDVVLVQQTILGDFVEGTAGIGIVPEEPQAKLSDTNKEFFNPAEDAMGAELVEAEDEGIEKVACEESANGKFVLPEEQVSAELVEETEFQGEDVVPVQQTILRDFVEATAGIGIVPEEPQAKLSETNKEFFNPAEDAMGAEFVEAEEEGIEKVACEETANGKFVLPEEQASGELEEGTEDKAQDVIPEQQCVANLMEATAEGIDAVSEDKLEATLAPDEESRAESWIDKNKELLDAGKDEIGAALVDAAEEIENQVGFEKSFSMEKLGLSKEQAFMEFVEEETQDNAQDALLDQQLVADLAEATEGIDVVSEYKHETGRSPDEEQPIAILSDINKGLVVDSAADRIDAELVDATTEVSENDETQVVSKEWLIERFKLAEKQASAAELEEEAKDKVQHVIPEAKDEAQDVIPEAKDEAQDVIPEQQPVAKLAEAADGIDVMMEDVLKMAGMTIGKELGATNEELTDSAKDRISTSLVEMTAVIENDTNIVSKEPPVDRLEMSEEQAFVELHEEAEDEAANVIAEQEPVAAELAEEGTDRIDFLIEDELQARITQDEEFRAELSDTNKELVDSAQDGTSADLVEATSGMENHTQVVSKEPPVDTRLELPEEQASTDDKAEDFTPEEQPVANLRAATEGIYGTTINELEIGMSHDEEPNAEFSEFVDAVEDKIYTELVETMEGIENDTWMVWEESSIDRLRLPEEQTSAMLEEETQEDYKAEETPVVVGLAEAVDGGIEVANEDELEEAGITHDAVESRPKLIDTIEELVDSAQDKIGAELVETTGGMGDNTREVVSRDLSVERLELSEEKAFAELEEETEQKTDKNVTHELKSVTAELVEATDAIEFVFEESVAAKLSDTNKELVDSAYKKAGVELVEAATRGIENVFEVKVELTSTLNHQLVADAQIDKELVEAVPTLEKTDQLAAEEMTIKNKLDAIMEEKQEVLIPVYPQVHSKPIEEAEAIEAFAPSLAMHVQVSEIEATNLAAAAETEETMRIPEAGRPSPLIPGAFALDTDSMTIAVFLDPLVEPKHSPTTVISGWQRLWCQFLGTR